MALWTITAQAAITVAAGSAADLGVDVTNNDPSKSVSATVRAKATTATGITTTVDRATRLIAHGATERFAVRIAVVAGVAPGTRTIDTFVFATDDPGPDTTVHSAPVTLTIPRPWALTTDTGTVTLQAGTATPVSIRVTGPTGRVAQLHLVDDTDPATPPAAVWAGIDRPTRTLGDTPEDYRVTLTPPADTPHRVGTLTAEVTGPPAADPLARTDLRFEVIPVPWTVTADASTVVLRAGRPTTITMRVSGPAGRQAQLQVVDDVDPSTPPAALWATVDRPTRTLGNEPEDYRVTFTPPADTLHRTVTVTAQVVSPPSSGPVARAEQRLEVTPVPWGVTTGHPTVELQAGEPTSVSLQVTGPAGQKARLRVVDDVDPSTPPAALWATVDRPTRTLGNEPEDYRVTFTPPADTPRRRVTVTAQVTSPPADDPLARADLGIEVTPAPVPWTAEFRQDLRVQAGQANPFTFEMSGPPGEQAQIRVVDDGDPATPSAVAWTVVDRALRTMGDGPEEVRFVVTPPADTADGLTGGLTLEVTSPPSPELVLSPLDFLFEVIGVPTPWTLTTDHPTVDLQAGAPTIVPFRVTGPKGRAAQLRVVDNDPAAPPAAAWATVDRPIRTLGDAAEEYRVTFAPPADTPRRTATVAAVLSSPPAPDQRARTVVKLKVTPVPVPWKITVVGTQLSPGVFHPEFVSVSVVNDDPDPAGRRATVTPTGFNDPGMATWVTIDQGTRTLPANSTTRFRINAQVPMGIPAGVYAFSVRVDSTDDPRPDTRATSRLIAFQLLAVPDLTDVLVRDLFFSPGLASLRSTFDIFIDQDSHPELLHDGDGPPTGIVDGQAPLPEEGPVPKDTQIAVVVSWSKL